MNPEEMFNTWKRHREGIEVSPGFSERVMARLGECQAPRQASAASAWLVRRVVARPWAKAAVVVLGVLAGLVRIIVTLDLILRA